MGHQPDLGLGAAPCFPLWLCCLLRVHLFLKIEKEKKKAKNKTEQKSVFESSVTWPNLVLLFWPARALSV